MSNENIIIIQETPTVLEIISPKSTVLEIKPAKETVIIEVSPQVENHIDIISDSKPSLIEVTKSVPSNDSINATRLRVDRIASEEIFAQEVVYAVSPTHVALATADNVREKSMVFGIADFDAAIGETVSIVLLGVVSNASFSSFTLNDPLFLDVDGGITNVKRISGFHVIVGKSFGGNDILFQPSNPTVIA